MKNNLKFIIFIIIFIILVCTITINMLYTKYSIKGIFEVNRKRFDVVFTNVMIDNDEVKVKLENDKKFVHIDISKLSNEEEINIDIKNIGNIDAVVKNYSFSNIDTNSNDTDVLISTSIQNGDIIKKGESKKLTIKIVNKSKVKDIYYNFNINYLFDEYNL